MAGAAMGNAAGRAATAGQDTGNVQDLLNKAGVQLDPSQQAALQNHFARQAGQDSLNQQMQGGAFLAQVGNQAQNLNTERAMALNQQANAAANVSNQLQQLGNARRDNANAISNAMNTVGGMYR
jgi:uncharacterized membrane-anchored protein YhcB (DUF1043 family)